jgi:nitroimidazol reductase NimA-like FMN-containing flavoprotein (pyridoxamine 5'-phosphate oxidase superfamily)
MESLPVEECLELLRASTVGRISVVVDGFPAILPVNHRLVEKAGATAVYLRTREGTIIDRAPAAVALQIDGFDHHTRQGWSVLVRGTLRHARDEQVGDVVLESWAAARDTWVLIEATEITGRRLHASPTEWPFHPHAYL